MVDEKQNLSPLEQEREKLKDKVDKKEQGDLQQIRLENDHRRYKKRWRNRYAC